MLADLNMNAFRATNSAVPSAATDAARISSIQSSNSFYAVASGTAPTYTATLSPAITAYSQIAQTLIKIKFTTSPSSPTETTQATLNLNGLGALPVYGPDFSTAARRNVVGPTLAGTYLLEYSATNFDGLGTAPSFRVLNPFSQWRSFAAATATFPGTTHTITINEYNYLVQGGTVTVHFALTVDTASATKGKIVLSLPIGAITSTNPIVSVIYTNSDEIPSNIHNIVMNSLYGVSTGGGTIDIYSTQNSGSWNVGGTFPLGNQPLSGLPFLLPLQISGVFEYPIA
jgi:hypothetical protein